MTTASDANQALKQDVAGLEQKRQILEQIGDSTRAIESMQESLNAVLVMGVASKDLPEDALKLYSALSGSMRNLPVNKIKEYYGNLEILVKKQLNRVLNYSGVDFEDDDQVEFITLSSESDEQSPVELLEAFKRTAQTAVSLRVLLRKRGVQTPGSALPATTGVPSARPVTEAASLVTPPTTSAGQCTSPNQLRSIVLRANNSSSQSCRWRSKRPLSRAQLRSTEKAPVREWTTKS